MRGIESEALTGTEACMGCYTWWNPVHRRGRCSWGSCSPCRLPCTPLRGLWPPHCYQRKLEVIIGWFIFSRGRWPTSWLVNVQLSLAAKYDCRRFVVYFLIRRKCQCCPAIVKITHALTKWRSVWVSDCPPNLTTQVEDILCYQTYLAIKICIPNL